MQPQTVWCAPQDKHRLGGCPDSASPRESARMRFLGTTGASGSIGVGRLGRATTDGFGVRHMLIQTHSGQALPHDAGQSGFRTSIGSRRTSTPSNSSRSNANRKAKSLCPITRPLRPPLPRAVTKSDSLATWREEFFEAPSILFSAIWNFEQAQVPRSQQS
jgi:hypothetical protein